MFSKRHLSTLGHAIASISEARGDAPIILVAAAPGGDPYDLNEAVGAMAAAMGYEPSILYLTTCGLGDLQPGVGCGATLSKLPGPDELHVLDLRSTPGGSFTEDYSQDVLHAAIERINEAPMRRAPIVAILPDDGDTLARATRKLIAHMPGVALSLLSVQL